MLLIEINPIFGFNFNKTIWIQKSIGDNSKFLLAGPGTDKPPSLTNENVPTPQSMQQPPTSSQQPIVSSPQGITVSSSSKTVMSNSSSVSHSMTTSDAQFLQQQSQIFVFSTRMANDAAELVMAGKYKNILNFHMDQSETQKFLQVIIINEIVLCYAATWIVQVENFGVLSFSYCQNWIQRIPIQSRMKRPQLKYKDKW